MSRITVFMRAPHHLYKLRDCSYEAEGPGKEAWRRDLAEGPDGAWELTPRLRQEDFCLRRHRTKHSHFKVFESQAGKEHSPFEAPRRWEMGGGRRGTVEGKTNVCHELTPLFEDGSGKERVFFNSMLHIEDARVPCSSQE